MVEPEQISLFLSSKEHRKVAHKMLSFQACLLRLLRLLVSVAQRENGNGSGPHGARPFSLSRATASSFQIEVAAAVVAEFLVH